MKLLRLALATATVIFGLLFTVSMALGWFDYAKCRSTLGGFHGVEGIASAYACNYDMRFTIEAGALALAFGVASYFLLRSRWRRRAASPLPTSN